MTKKNYLLIIILLTVTNIINAQKKEDIDFAQNSVYIELGGTGLIYSINYERNLIKGKTLYANARIGITAIPNDYYNVPLELILLKGKKKSFIEVGLGYSPWIEPNSYKDNFRRESYTRVSHYFVPKLGYRYQKPKGGFLFKISVTPTIFYISDTYYNNDFNLWGGISLGYCF